MRDTETIVLDASCHSADAVQRAAYRFIHKLAVSVSVDEGDIHCVLRCDPQHTAQLDELIQEFRKEVLDQVLRERIRAETAPIRAFVLALAYSRTGLIDSTSQS
jgi:His-Xaa-Ser system protein HxsD